MAVFKLPESMTAIFGVGTAFLLCINSVKELRNRLIQSSKLALIIEKIPFFKLF